jgi:hypothetical protein
MISSVPVGTPQFVSVMFYEIPQEHFLFSRFSLVLSRRYRHIMYQFIRPPASHSGSEGETC